jgi:hypothetical protein
MLRYIDQEDDNYSSDQVAGLDLRGLYQQADKALGGWLPGGGTGNALSKPVQQAASAARQAPATAAKALRDLAIVPAIDKGIESGVLPVKEAMFARYLTGTEKPLTTYPKQAKEAIKGSLDDLAIENTREKVDQLHKEKNPDYIKLSAITTQLRTMQRTVSARAETGGPQPTDKELSTLAALEKEQAKLAKKLGLKGIILGDEPAKVSKQERLKIIKEHGLFDESNVATNFDAAYGGSLPNDVQLSLGRFAIKDGEIRDRYKFDNLETGRQQLQGWGNVYPDAAGGREAASNLIEMGLRMGTITPSSGYDIRIPLNKR